MSPSNIPDGFVEAGEMTARIFERHPEIRRAVQHARKRIAYTPGNTKEVS